MPCAHCLPDCDQPPHLCPSFTHALVLAKREWQLAAWMKPKAPRSRPPNPFDQARDDYETETRDLLNAMDTFDLRHVKGPQ